MKSESPFPEIKLRLNDLLKAVGRDDDCFALKLDLDSLSKVTADNQDEIIDLLSKCLLFGVEAAEDADSFSKAGRLIEAVDHEVRHIQGMRDSYEPLARTMAEAT